MRITIIGSGSYRSSLSIRIVALGRQLSQIGWTVTLIVPAADKYNHFTKQAASQTQNFRVLQPWQLSTPQALLNLAPYLITALCTSLFTRPQLIYIYKPTPISIFGLIFRIFKIPVILDLDDLGSAVMSGEGQPRWQVKLVAWCEQLAIRYASAIVVSSHFLKETVAQLAPAKPVLILPNGVDPQLYPVRHAQALRPHVYYFGMINRLSLIEPLLQAAPAILEAFPETKFTIIGGGSALPDAQELASRLKIAGSFTFTGQTDMLGVIDHTQFGDIAVCYQPDIDTVRAASNMKVFQYLALSSVPVVSAVGDLPLYLHADTAGITVPADNSAQLAQAIIRLLQDPATRTAKALQARRLAEIDYAWSRLGRRLSDFLKSVAGGQL